MKRTTIKDIANRLCLSVSTVSRALADDKNIRRETKDRIFAVAREMGYVRNVVAANLRTGQSRTIAVLVDQMITPYATKILKGVNDAMRERGIYVVTCDADNDPALERENIRLIEDSFIDGIIVAHCNYPENHEHFNRLYRSGRPMVFLRDSLDGIDAPVIGVNNYDKGFYLVDHLVCNGRRRIVNIKAHAMGTEMRDLDRAYNDVMAKFGLPVIPELQIEAGTDTAAGREVADRLIDNNVDFDAVFAMNELVAIGVMNRLMERGIKVPQQVAVAAFTGSMLSEMVHPKLTSVETPLEDMGRQAAEMLYNIIRQPSKRQGNRTVEAMIKVRNSSTNPTAN